MSARYGDNVISHSKNMPWYAAFISLGNPLAGLAVLAGERVLRGPLEQFSSAKYAISGTLDDPEVEFVSIFDTSTREPEMPEGAVPAATKMKSSQLEPEPDGNGDGTKELLHE